MDIKKVSDNVYEISQETQQCMNVPVKIYASDALVQKMKQDATFKQATNAEQLMLHVFQVSINIVLYSPTDTKDMDFQLEESQPQIMKTV